VKQTITSNEMVKISRYTDMYEAYKISVPYTAARALED
jgi:hypothetical protein